MQKQRHKHRVHIVLDVETTALNPNEGRIWQLGALAVIQHTCKETGAPAGSSVLLADKHGFKYTINPSSLLSGGLYAEDTLAWQLEKNRANWNTALEEERTYLDLLSQGLPEFNSWINEMSTFASEGEPLVFWSQGMDFDFPFLEQAYKEAQIKVPWKYYQRSDLRTVRNLLKNAFRGSNKEAAHDALLDAQYQAEVLSGIFNYLGTVRGVVL